MFIFLVFHQHCKSRSGALQKFFRSTTRRSNTFVIKPGGYESSRFKKYWSSFLHSCLVCTIIYNSLSRAGCTVLC